jgi:hypothetical protein
MADPEMKLTVHMIDYDVGEYYFCYRCPAMTVLE